MKAFLPLGDDSKLAKPNFEIPISFIYGDHDWVQEIEKDIADIVVEQNKFYMSSEN